MMKQRVPANFINYVKFYLERSDISSRKLGKEIGMSSNYVSSLLLGKIKTISYDTAYKLIKALTPGVDVERLLIEDFGIEPDELIEKRMEEMEKEQEHLIQRIKQAEEEAEKLKNDLMADLVNNQAFEKLDIIKEIISEPLHSDYFKLLEVIKYLRKHKTDKYGLLLLVADELYHAVGMVFGEFIEVRKNEEDLKHKISKFLGEVLADGTGKEGKEV